MAQFSIYVHKGGLKPDSFHFFSKAETQTSGSGFRIGGTWKSTCSSVAKCFYFDSLPSGQDQIPCLHDDLCRIHSTSSGNGLSVVLFAA